MFPTKVLDQLKSQNATLRGRNQKLNLHCEEADQKIEDLVQQIRQLELTLRKERSKAIAKAKRDVELAAAAAIESRSPRSPRLPKLSSITPKDTMGEMDENVPYFLSSSISSSTTTNKDDNKDESCMVTTTLEERVESFLESNNKMNNNYINSSLISFSPSSPTRASSIMQKSNDDNQVELLRSKIDDLNTNVVELKHELAIAREELLCEQTLRKKLENELQSYHTSSVRHADEASALSQRMRLAELARQSAEIQSRKLEAELRNLQLEDSNKKSRVVNDLVADYQCQIVSLKGAKVAAEDRAQSFQQQAVDTLKQLMKMQNENDEMEMLRKKKKKREQEFQESVEEEYKFFIVPEVATPQVVSSSMPSPLPLSPHTSTPIPLPLIQSTSSFAVSPPLNSKYSLKLKRLQDEYNKVCTSMKKMNTKGS